MKKPFIAIMLLPLMLGACWDKNLSNNPGSTDERDSCVYDVCDSFTVATDSLNGGLPKSIVHILVEKPIIEEEEVRTTLEAQLASILSGQSNISLPEAVQSLGDSVRADHRNSLEALYGDTTYTMTYAYTYTFDNRIRLIDSTRQEIIGYEGTLITYQGGAHGGFRQMLLNFNRKNGRLITAEEAFDSSRTEELLQIIRQQICDQFVCKSIEELQEQYGLLVLGDVFVNDANFLLMQDGVRFHFDPYDIGPWATGSVNVLVPYDKLGDLFTAF